MSMIRNVARAVMILGLGVVIVGIFPFVACQPAVEVPTEALPGNSCQLVEQKEEDVFDSNRVLTSAAIPPVDTLAPTKTETATFALG